MFINRSLVSMVINYLTKQGVSYTKSYPKSTQLNYIINNSANNNSWMKLAEILIVLKSAPPVGGSGGTFVVSFIGGLVVAVSLDVSALLTDNPSLLAYRKWSGPCIFLSAKKLSESSLVLIHF